MADSFQPKFADLVRNFTTTTGTGNLVLSDVPPGFTSFASALSAGDNFYYSVVSLDRTAESEVGRGTLQADGSISRDPIGGVLTDFSNGTKSVALVTAAEWYQSAATVSDVSAATSFSAASTGLAARPIADKAGDIISVKDFAAVGDGAADDTPAIVAAFVHGCMTGTPIFVPRGTYLINPQALDMFTVGAASFVMFGEGASSVIKIKDGAIQADGKRMFFLRPTSPMDVIEFRDLLLDHNARGSPVPEDPWAYEQSHTFAITPNAAVKMIRFHNVVIKDPAADGISFASAVEDRCSYFVVDNCAVLDRTRLRSDIQFGTFPKNAVITGFAGDVIEAEPVSGSTTSKRVQISNSNVNRLDFGSNVADWANGLVELHLDNVTAPEKAHFGGIMLRASNCVFGIAADVNFNRWQVLQPGSQVSGSLFLHKYNAATNSVGSLTPWTSPTYGSRTNLRLVGCESRIDSSDPAIAPVGPAILGTAGVPLTNLDNTSLDVVNHKFDSRFQVSVTADRCGRVRLLDNDYGGRAYAIRYQSGAAYAVDVSVWGGDFRRVSGASVGTAADATVDQSSGVGYLRLAGDQVGVKTPWVNISGGLFSGSNKQVYSSRRMTMTALPVSGILGDIVELQEPAAGAVDSWRCTVPGPQATWKARTSLAA